MFFSGHGVKWRAGAARWLRPEIKVTGDGGVSIMMPLGSAVAGKDLMVECKGDFDDKMTVRGAVTHSSGFYTTSAADFSYVSDTLKFIIAVPTTAFSDPAFSIGMRSTDEEIWWLTSCSVTLL